MVSTIKHYPNALLEEGGVMHFVITPEKGQFEQLGQTLEERLKAFKELVCKTAQGFLFNFKFVELRWIAAIHVNTEIPHAHLAISREH